MISRQILNLMRLPVSPYPHNNERKFFQAGVEGIGPSSGVLETLILPLNYTPKLILSFSLYYQIKVVVQAKGVEPSCRSDGA